MNILREASDDFKFYAFPAGHLPVEAEEDILRWLAHLGYGPGTIGKAINWYKVHGTLDTCPHIMHNHARAASAVASFVKERAIGRIVASN